MSPDSETQSEQGRERQKKESINLMVQYEGRSWAETEAEEERKDAGKPRQAYEARWEEGEDIILFELHFARFKMNATMQVLGNDRPGLWASGEK